jgi:hypothetical protein
MICVWMRPECWRRQASLSCSPWKSVCHDWRTTDATHNCMPGCLKYLSSYSRLVDLCVWILFMCYQKLKVIWVVICRDEGTFEPTLDMLSRENRTTPLLWEVMRVYPTLQCLVRLCLRTWWYSTIIWHFPDGKTHWNWTCFETCSLLGLYAAKSCNSVQTFWDNQLVTSSRFKMSKKNVSW